MYKRQSWNRFRKLSFCTIEPNIGIVPVNDSRLQSLANIVSPEKILPTTMEFVDIAGLVEGASKGEGLGNQFLSNIRETDAILHVVRCFEDENITHVNNEINPLDDIETINTELILSDLELLEKIKSGLEKKSKSGDEDSIKKVAASEILIKYLINFKLITLNILIYFRLYSRNKNTC